MFEPSELSLVIADDHPLLLQGLKDTLENYHFKEVITCNNGTSALEAIIHHQPELAILDIEMPYLSGLAVAEECKKRNLNTQVIILSYHKEYQFIAKAKALNISGYILKEDTTTEIYKCLEQVYYNKFYYSPSIREEVTSSDLVTQKLQQLSPSELKILKLIAESLGSQAIAEMLHISERTVEKHRSNIITKLDIAKQSNSLAIWAIEQRHVIQGM
tara:strand:- start:61 stop:708 length:648 start_codon:yes stop_codon:yes gene_type:complete